MKINTYTKRAAFAFAFALIFPLLFRIGFGGSFSISLLLLMIGVKTVVSWLEARENGPLVYFWLGLSVILSLAYAALTLASIVITPYSSYKFWLENVQFGEAEGTVSNVLVAVIAFLSVSISRLVFKGQYTWAGLAMALAVSSMLAFVYQSPGHLLLVLVVLAAIVGYMAYSGGYRGTRMRSSLSLAGLFAFCLILAAIFTGNPDPKGSRFVDVTLYPALRSSVLEVFPRFPLLYAIPGYGYSFNETKRLGGTPILSTAAIFEMTMTERERLYLRTRSYDYYDGETWQLSTGVDDQVERGVLYRSPRQQPGEISLKLLSEYYSMVPHTLDTTRVRFENSSPSIQFGNREIGILLDKPIKRNAVFHVQRDSTFQGPTPGSLNPFLQVPDDIPETVTFLAEQLATGDVDRQTILRRIEQYLAINYTYSLEIEEEGEYSEDFVTDFLFGELQGYCVHFATSFALLARLNSIPTRYVTGFLINPPPEGDLVEVTGLNAHAWPEVWLDEQGWTAWEATPALNPINWDLGDDAWLYNLGLGGDNLTNQQLRQVMGPMAAPVNQEASDFEFPYLWVSGALVIAVLVVTLRWLAVRISLLLRHDRRAFVYRLTRMVRTGRRRGVRNPEQIGWVSWGGTVGQKFELDGSFSDRAVDLINRTIYGGQEPTRKDIRFLSLYMGRLKRSPGR